LVHRLVGGGRVVKALLIGEDQIGPLPNQFFLDVSGNGSLKIVILNKQYSGRGE
jgi:hypothetical protein